MANPDLRIITFAVPYPPNYGGAIDVYNKVKALHNEGVKVRLHCFVYGSFSPHAALKEVTDEVHYYPRITWPALLSPGMPYIVASRKNPKLLADLSTDSSPILFEGIHTTGFLDDFKGRKKLLRAHNIEHQYYNHLAQNSQRFQYLFFQRESLALERYECSKACSFDHVFAISKNDQAWYEKKGAKCDFIPAFHGIEKTDINNGKGDYLLYQGDLSIESNQKAVLELLKAPGIEQYPVVIAGRAGERIFEEKLTKYSNLRREVDVSVEAMTGLIKDAQVVLIHSRHSSGMKVKIFPALYHGRFIVANENCRTKTPVDNEMQVYKHVNELAPILQNLWSRKFNDENSKARTVALKAIPDDREKAREIMRYL